MSVEKAYRKAYAEHAQRKLTDSDNLTARERYELEQRHNRLAGSEPLLAMQDNSVNIPRTPDSE